jgi:hypothetical protein
MTLSSTDRHKERERNEKETSAHDLSQRSRTNGGGGEGRKQLNWPHEKFANLFFGTPGKSCRWKSLTWMKIDKSRWGKQKG